MNGVVMRSADVLRTWDSLKRHSSLDEGCLQRKDLDRRKTLDSAAQAGGFMTCLQRRAVAPADRKTLDILK